MIIGSTPFTSLSGIPEEEVASVKDSVTSRLPARRCGESVEASGLSGRPVIPKFKVGKGYMTEDDGIEGVKKMEFVP